LVSADHHLGKNTVFFRIWFQIRLLGRRFNEKLTNNCRF
jgi:hypothetical protein